MRANSRWSWDERRKGAKKRSLPRYWCLLVDQRRGRTYRHGANPMGRVRNVQMPCASFRHGSSASGYVLDLWSLEGRDCARVL